MTQITYGYYSPGEDICEHTASMEEADLVLIPRPGGDITVVADEFNLKILVLRPHPQGPQPPSLAIVEREVSKLQDALDDVLTGIRVWKDVKLNSEWQTLDEVLARWIEASSFNQLGS